MRSLARPVICLVTDRSRLRADDDLVRLVRRAASSGVNLVQIRERHIDDRRLYALTQRILSAVGGGDARVVVNDRVDVAIAAGAHGVHLRADSVGAERVRRIAPGPFLIGRSVHSVEQAEAAGPVDYLIMGTIFPTRSKPKEVVPAGLERLEAVCRAVPLPVLAIGGVSADKLGNVAAAGAAGIAAIELFSEAVEHSDEHLEETLRALVADTRRAFATQSDR